MADDAPDQLLSVAQALVLPDNGIVFCHFPHSISFLSSHRRLFSTIYMQWASFKITYLLAFSTVLPSRHRPSNPLQSPCANLCRNFNSRVTSRVWRFNPAIYGCLHPLCPISLRRSFGCFVPEAIRLPPLPDKPRWQTGKSIWGRLPLSSR